ncbi:MAG: GNAT family N-acetyltransferase [Actinomycetota bacterium]
MSGTDSTTTSEPVPSPWATTVVLGDGDTAYVRPLVPADAPRLLAFHERQSAESRYRRFFSAKPTLSQKELEHFTTVDMVNRVALAVEVRDEFVAWASYERWTGRNEAEAAFMVDDEHHGRGIATLLLEHLAAIARTNGIDRFTAEVLADNRGMLTVFARAGWPLQRRFESGVVDLDWELATTDEFLDTVERREQRADSRAIARLLQPRAVAVVGASDRAGSVGRLLWEHVRASVEVPVHAVNPRLEDLDGHRCFGSVDDLPDDVSLAVIAVPTSALDSTIDACIAKRMRGAIVVTSVDDPAAANSVDLDGLVARSRRNGLRIIGPASMGVAGLHEGRRIQAGLVEVDLRPGGVAISMQSGTLGASVLRRADDLDLGLSWFVSLGDKSDVSANDLLQFWEDDDRTTVVGLYSESFGNPAKFARIARRVSRTRPIVAVRSGTAADGPLGGTLYQQAGLIEVPSVTDLLDTCRLLETQPVLRGPHVSIVSNAASPTSLTATALETAGLVPVDAEQALDWRSTSADYATAIDTELERDGVDGLVVVYAPPVPSAEASVGDAIERASRRSDKPVVAVMIGSPDGRAVTGGGVPNFAFPEQAAAALGRSFGYHRWRTTEDAGTDAPNRPIDPTRAAELIDRATARPVDGDGRVDMTIDEVVALLDASAIPMATTRAASPERAAVVAAEVGYPVAVKTRRRTGRSAAGGLALDLNHAEDVDEAIATMRAAREGRPGRGLDEVVVQEMVDAGLTVRVRCHRDPQLGAVVAVGYGGLDADLVDDRTTRVAPVSPAAAGAMLHETRVGPALAELGIDTSLLVDLVVSASQLAAQHPRVTELDLNPVVVARTRTVVTDATVSLSPAVAPSTPLRRLD